MVKKGLKNSWLLVLLLVSFLGFVLAAHVITTFDGESSFSVNEDTSSLFNVTVNNTDAGQLMNITSVNITLPSGASCVFVDATNGSSVGSNGTSISDTFVNDSNVLSWTNTTIYVLNGTESKYFWFNVTCATPGDYNISVSTTNATGNYASNLSFEINDTNAPVITLIAPTNATSSTTDAYNFTFNVTDDSTVSNCSLVWDGASTNNLTTINNTGGTMGMYNSSLSVATHTWSINCTDSAGNVGNSSTRTLIVEAAAAAAATITGGSGGTPTYRPSTEVLNEGYERVLYKNWKVGFDVGEESHVLELKSLDETSATITVSSETQTATLAIGEEKKFELSGDDYYDLLVKLVSVDMSNTIRPEAEFVIQTINEEIVSGDEAGAGDGDAMGDEGDNGGSVGEAFVDVFNNLKEGSWKTWAWTGGAIILLVIIIIGLVIWKKKD